MKYSELKDELFELKKFKEGYQSDAYAQISVILMKKILEKLEHLEEKLNTTKK